MNHKPFVVIFRSSVEIFVLKVKMTNLLCVLYFHVCFNTSHSTSELAFLNFAELFSPTSIIISVSPKDMKVRIDMEMDKRIWKSKSTEGKWKSR